MIEFKFDGNGEGLEKMVLGGTVIELAADISALISMTYGVIKSRSEESAKQFKRLIGELVIDREIRNKVFSDELAKSIGIYESKKKKAEKEEESIEDLIERLIAMLEREDGEDEDDEDESE